MSLFELGGWMMWPLLLASIAALAIIVERLLLVMSCPFPGPDFATLLLETARTGDSAALRERLGQVKLLDGFTRILGDAGYPNREAALRLAGEAVVRRLETRLPLLGMLARLSPLMGLLGTVLGMITTFSRIADAPSGVDMTMLAGGIWQALLTTAAGLFIAIPALFFLHFFQGRARRVAAALSQAGNTVLFLRDGKA